MRDFCGFSFNGRHSDEFNIIRTSTSKRYQDDLTPGTNNTTVSINGRDGKLFVSSTQKERIFTVNFAFDSLSEQQLRQLRTWLCGDNISSLIFDEEPYKEYSAKVQGKVQLKYLCFDKSKDVRVYKGDGSINFVCYYPYAHTPAEVSSIYGSGDGRLITSYSRCNNINEWEAASGITNKLNNPGDLPTNFIIQGLIQDGQNNNYSVNQNDKIKISFGNNEVITIIFNESMTEQTNIYWNSKTGIVKFGSKIVKVTGNTILKLPITSEVFKIEVIRSTDETNNIDITNLLTYQYLYY